jgi:predicted RNA binding protein YcfA (HicA-like mRNA interferase family)
MFGLQINWFGEQKEKMKFKEMEKILVRHGYRLVRVKKHPIYSNGRV